MPKPGWYFELSARSPPDSQTTGSSFPHSEPDARCVPADSIPAGKGADTPGAVAHGSGRRGPRGRLYATGPDPRRARSCNLEDADADVANIEGILPGCLAAIAPSLFFPARERPTRTDSIAADVGWLWQPAAAFPPWPIPLPGEDGG